MAVAQSLNFAHLKVLPQESTKKRKQSQDGLPSATKNGESKTHGTKNQKLNKHYAPHEELLSRDEIVQMIAMKQASRPASKMHDTSSQL